MIFGMGIIISTLIFSIVILAIYIYKKKINNFETKIYNVLSVLSISNLILEFWLCTNILLNVKLYGMYNFFINKAFLFMLFLWFSTFTLYVMVVSFQNNTKVINALKKKFGDNYTEKLLYIIAPILIIGVGLLSFLPIDLVKENGVAYSQGPAVNVVYFSAIFYLIIWTICVLVNYKKVRFKKFIPVIAYIICFGLILVARNFYPALLLNSFSVAFATILMFHTIENPDVKLINELNENRILVEKTNEEKSNFLFKMTTELRHPIDYIYEVSNGLVKETDIEKLNKGISVINSSSRKMSYLINEVLNVSSMDIKKLKVVNTKYNFYTIVNEIQARTNQENTKDIDIRYDISGDIPKSLYGDAIKIKQIIMTILSNSLKYTKEGFIELSVSSMIKYDVCRLIISIEDSGIGMDIAKVNDLLELDEEMSENDLKTLGKIDLNLNIVKKIVKYLGGSMMIKSELGKGSEFIIVLDQKIDLSNNYNLTNKYKLFAQKKTKVLLVNDDMEELNNIENILNKNNISSMSTTYSKDCIDKINNNYKFDLIIINDEMPEYSAYETLKRLKEIKGFNIPVVVILDKKKDFMKEHYIEDGFKDYILRESLDREVKRVIDKYL